MDCPLFTSDDDSNVGRRTNPASVGDTATTDEEGKPSTERYSETPLVTEKRDDRPLSPSSESTKPDPPPSVQGEADDRTTDEEELPRGGDATEMVAERDAAGENDTTQKIKNSRLDYISVPTLNEDEVSHELETATESGEASGRNSAGMMAEEAEAGTHDNLSHDAPNNEEGADSHEAEAAKDSGEVSGRSSAGLVAEEAEAGKHENLSHDAPNEKLTAKAEATEVQGFINGDISVMTEEKESLPNEGAVGAAEIEGRDGKGVYDAPPAQSISLPDSSTSLGRQETNAGGLAALPRVDEYHPPVQPATHAFTGPNLQHQGSYGYPPMVAPMGAPMGAPPMMMMVGGRRKIHLRLQEEVATQQTRRASLLGHLRQRSSRMMFGSGTLPALGELEFTLVDRGRISVSWFEGTTSLELQEHVRKSIVRKLGLKSNIQLEDIRVIDESVDPPEEIVLSPYIPDGSHFLLRFSTKDANDGTMTPVSQYSSYSVQRPPLSPSAAPSPRPTRDLSGLNANQIALLRNQLDSLAIPSDKAGDGKVSGEGGKKYRSERRNAEQTNGEKEKSSDEAAASEMNATSSPGKQEPSFEKGDAEPEDLSDGDEDDMVLHSEDPIEARLRQITELLLEDRKGKSRSSSRRQEKRQVIFVLANYFVLFLSLIAISAEIQARAPEWAAWMEEQLKSVQSCSADQDALFKCVSNGDFAGLIASVILWLSRSVATRRIFLFGFETPNKLWTVVYESLVAAFCWGISYLFIRRGMNPDTRSRFLQKYWKDAVYGSLAGFNAAFMKQVLKNLIPQEAVEDALRERHLKILHWLPSFQ